MTTHTTQPVDLAEARKLADEFKELHSVYANIASDIIRSLADEVEALRKQDAHMERWAEQMGQELGKADREVRALKAELAALKAVGPDGLPPLPEPCWFERKGYVKEPEEVEQDVRSAYDSLFDTRQMQAYARAAIAAQQPVEMTDEQILNAWANTQYLECEPTAITFARAALAAAKPYME